MGRHSIPDPDDRPDEASDDGFDDEPGADTGGGAGPRDHVANPDDPAEPVSGRLAAGGRRSIGQWRGGHRNEEGRRGVSPGVIIALVAVVAVVGVVILWRFFGHSLSHRSDAAAGRCVEGDGTVAVVADPSIAGQLQSFAERFNASVKPVGDRCVSVRVKPADADAVIAGFIGDWPAQLGERPALWVPGSSASVLRLQAATGRETVGDVRSLAESPVLLAMRPELKPGMKKQSWATLPELQSKPDALAGLGLDGWGSLRLALPTTGNSDAAFLAAEAVAEASAPRHQPASAGADAVRTLLNAQPKLKDDSITEALNTLLAPGDRATAPVHAVATTEQQLFARGQSLSNAGDMLTSWLPTGPAPVADYPTVLLSGSWLSREQASGASEFARFTRKSDQLTDLANAGFRVEGVDSPDSDVTSFGQLPGTLSVDDDELRSALANELTAPTIGPVAVTIMLDQSMDADDGGRARLSDVVAALDGRISALPPDSAVGLWSFDGIEGRSVVPTGPLTDDVDGEPRAAALTAGLDELSSTSNGAVSFTTLPMVYDDALANYRDGQVNSVLVITAGPHTDRTLGSHGLQDYVRDAADRQHPVAVNVIDFGDGSDREAWQAVAQLSGGSYQHLDTSDSPELAKALRALLG